MLWHDPDELVSASPQVHLVDHDVGVGAVIYFRGDDVVEGVRSLNTDVEANAIWDGDPDVFERGVGVFGEQLPKVRVGPSKFDERLLEVAVHGFLPIALAMVVRMFATVSGWLVRTWCPAVTSMTFMPSWAARVALSSKKDGAVQWT